ncbi:hypothetical protein QS306_08180 [Paraburkholderia bonniea]|uniref:plasmid mobilization protein n=1 Tax=Paraburkholderia bonniea TaxID=2152891 RepID=UPI001FE4CA6B|nr:hypothetical protein [Paraburkholderia bonniea]WJF89119.1 hypothetical protein QS306_08180 [Paraburkholderia bonniea]WJF92435.1 hypothetical protein QS308_08190 [Paraburkholderia bonniea]
MNPPSERIVVIVTPAQKRAIAARARDLGISVSELMRRAVLSFSATSEQMKVASIVDRLNAARTPDTLGEALRRVASSHRGARQNGTRTGALQVVPLASAVPAVPVTAATAITAAATAAPIGVIPVAAAPAAAPAEPTAPLTAAAPALALLPPATASTTPVAPDENIASAGPLPPVPPAA